MQNIQFSLIADVHYSEPMAREKTPSQAAILYYLQLRISQGGGPATQEEIKYATQLSDRTIEGALRKLRESGEVEKRVTWEPSKAQ